MKDQIILLLSGIGFYKLSERRRKILRLVLIISLGVHVLAMLIFGSWVIVKAAREEKTVFVAPPPLKTYEPRKLEHSVKVQKRQRSSSRPSMVPRMVSMKTSDLALPEIKMDPKIVHTSFQPKFKAVTGRGLGAGLGTGYGLGGFGAGVSSFDFFGIKGRGDKIAILVDVSVSMVEDQRGGAQGFIRVKNRINKVINVLQEGTLFNVIVFADAASVFNKKEMVVATDEHKSKGKLFLQPFNTPGNWGLTDGNINPSTVSGSVPAQGGTTRLDLALTAAFENGADTILIISDGLPRVMKGVTFDELRAYENMKRQWQESNRAQMESWQVADAAATYTTEKVWVPPQPARPARPPSKVSLKEGVKPDQGSPAQSATPGYWREVQVRHGGASAPRPQPPPPPQAGYWTLTDFVRHLEALHKELYEKKGKKLPVIHAIGYQIDKDGGDFLEALTRTYNGKYRRVAKIE